MLLVVVIRFRRLAGCRCRRRLPLRLAMSLLLPLPPRLPRALLGRRVRLRRLHRRLRRHRLRQGRQLVLPVGLPALGLTSPHLLLGPLLRGPLLRDTGRALMRSDRLRRGKLGKKGKHLRLPCGKIELVGWSPHR